MCVAGLSPSFSCLAMFCSNQSLQFRFLAPGRYATVHSLPWFEDGTKHVISMSFSGSAEHLLCLCLDGSLYIVYVLALILHDGSGTSHQTAYNESRMHLSSYTRDTTPQSPVARALGTFAARFVQAVDLSELPSQDVYLKFGVHRPASHTSSSFS